MVPVPFAGITITASHQGSWDMGRAGFYLERLVTKIDGFVITASLLSYQGRAEKIVGGPGSSKDRRNGRRGGKLHRPEGIVARAIRLASQLMHGRSSRIGLG